MLAQGEFRQLLEANSTQKQEIFSKIFGTDAYARLTGALAAREQEVWRSVQSAQEGIARCVAALASLGYTALSADSAQYLPLGEISAIVTGTLELHEEQMAQFAADIAALEKEKESIDLPGAKALNQKLRQYEDAVRSHKALIELEPDMRKNARQLERLEQVKHLQEQEAIIYATKDSIAQNEARVTALEEQQRQSTDAIVQLQQKLEALPAQKERLAALQQEYSALEQQQKSTQIQLRQKQQLDACKKSCVRLESALTGLQQAAKLLQLEEAAGLLDRQAAETRQLQRLTREYEAARELYEDLYHRFLNGQAALLAGELKEDAPCPVCGSAHHPAPATSLEQVPDAQTVSEAKVKLDGLAEELSRKKETLLQMTQKLGQVLPGGISQASREELLGQAARIRAEAAEELPVHLGKEGLDRRAEQAAGELEELRRSAAQLEGALEAREGALPPEDLQRKAQAVHGERTGLAEQIEAVQNTYTRHKSALDICTASLEATRLHLAELSDQFAKQRETFKAHMNAAGFARYNDYKAQIPLVPQIAGLSARVESYRKQLASANATVDALKQEVDGKLPVDLDELEKRGKELVRRLTTLRESQTELYALVSSSRTRLAELEELHRKAGDAGNRYRVLHELTTLAKGSRAPHLSFERFILASYFDDIIQIANIHLQRMTGLRYRLKRREERSQRTSGLDIEIIDSYTGKQRGVSTLSGGEGFKASLALALGLSDVVQMYAGGISIDTMFIDEGFGSLDEKSLDSAVDTLFSLEKNGRMVGIISHVPQLGAYIPTRLVVRYEATGSTARWEDRS